MDSTCESKGIKRIIKEESESNKKGKFELDQDVKEEPSCDIKVEPFVVKEEPAALSWAEQYEQMKRERLAKEEASKPKSFGFASSPIKKEHDSVETNSIAVKTEQISTKELVQSDPSENTSKTEDIKPTAKSKVSKTDVIDGSLKEPSPLQSKKNDDPWLAAYEAKKRSGFKKS